MHTITKEEHIDAPQAYEKKLKTFEQPSDPVGNKIANQNQKVKDIENISKSAIDGLSEQLEKTISELQKEQTILNDFKKNLALEKQKQKQTTKKVTHQVAKEVNTVKLNAWVLLKKMEMMLKEFDNENYQPEADNFETRLNRITVLIKKKEGLLDEKFRQLKSLLKKMNKNYSSFKNETLKECIDYCKENYTENPKIFSKIQTNIDAFTNKISAQVKKIESLSKQIDILNKIIDLLNLNILFLTDINNPQKVNIPILVQALLTIDLKYQDLIKYTDKISKHLETTLNWSKNYLNNFTISHYTKIIKKYITIEKNFDSFHNQMKSAIENVLKTENIEAIQNLDKNLNSLKDLLKQIKNPNLIQNVSTWIENYNALCELFPDAVPMMNAELEASIAKFRDTKLDNNIYKRILQYKNFQNEHQAKTKEIIQRLSKNPASHFQSLIKQYQNFEHQFQLQLQVDVNTLEKNIFVLDSDASFGSSLYSLKDLYTKLNIDIDLFNGIFSNNQIQRLKTNATNNFNNALLKLLKNYESSLPNWDSSEDKKDYNANEERIAKLQNLLRLLPQIGQVSSLKIIDELRNLANSNDLEKAKANNFLTLQRISLREVMVDGFIKTISDKQDNDARGSNRFLEKLSSYLQDYKNTGNSTKLRKFIPDQSDKNLDISLQLLINNILLAVDDQDNLPKNGKLKVRPPIPTPLSNNNNAVSKQIQNLYDVLKIMEKYGQSNTKDQTTIDLAQALTRRLNAFVCQNVQDIKQGKIDAQKLHDFQKIFSVHLHTKDDKMQNQRGWFGQNIFSRTTTRAMNIREVETALYDLITEEPMDTCAFGLRF